MSTQRPEWDKNLHLPDTTVIVFEAGGTTTGLESRESILTRDNKKSRLIVIPSKVCVLLLLSSFVFEEQSMNDSKRESY